MLQNYKVFRFNKLDKLLEIHIISKLTQEEIDNLNSLVLIKHLILKIKKLPIKKIPVQMVSLLNSTKHLKKKNNVNAIQTLEN